MDVRDILIPPIGLEGILMVPRAAGATVVFAHGSGSSRFSPRNTQVANALNAAGLATLMFDLLTEEEAEDRANVFDIALLAKRLVLAAAWLRDQPEFRERAIGYFGASTGAAAALVASTLPRGKADAIVSRGGRPDLAGPALGKVTAPTLLIVGGEDDVVLDLNRAALAELHATKKLAIVPGATHLFEEPGTLEQVSSLAQQWFCEHLMGQKRVRHG